MGWLWLVLGIFLVFGELLTREFLLIWFALGAFFAGIITFFLPFGYQLLSFFFVSMILRFLFWKTKLEKKEPKTNLDTLVGKEAIVVETVQRVYCDRGLVKLNGEIWRAYCEGDSILAGTNVLIVEVSGAKLKVKK